MKDRAKAMVMASFAADSLALGAHWIYDTALIEKQFGRVEDLVKPLPESFHPNKNCGEFTHYGDQALNLLESVINATGFELNHFARHWQDLFDGYQGYLDKATQTTLGNFSGGKGPEESGSGSTDLGGAARVAPLAYFYRQDLECLIASARAQTAMTHNHPDVIDSAEFFARAAWKVLRKTPPVSALEQVVKESFKNTPLAGWVADGVNSADRDSREAIAAFGQMCDTRAAFPAVVHLLAKYEGNLKDALIENVMAGGDSAARGMIVGMISGAHLGLEAIPAKWLSDLKEQDLIVRLLDKIV